MLYKDGNYAVPPSAPVTLQASGVRYITVTGDYRGCGAIDWEPGNPCFTPAGLRGYVRGRRGINAVARAYCNRANASEAISYLEDYGHGSLLGYEKLVWWIATLDNHQWGQAELAADLANNWDAPIAPGKLWGNQYVTQPDGYDETVLYGKF
jgi:hypothetical protein